MIQFKKNIVLSQSELSNSILSRFSEFSKDNFSFEEFENVLLNIFETHSTLGKDKLKLIQDIICDISEDNLDFSDKILLDKLGDSLDTFEHKAKVQFFSEQSSGELPLSAYEYKGNSNTRFKKSLKLPSLLYQL